MASPMRIDAASTTSATKQHTMMMDATRHGERGSTENDRIERVVNTHR